MDFGEGGVWILSKDRSCLGFALMRFSGVRMGRFDAIVAGGTVIFHPFFFVG